MQQPMQFDVVRLLPLGGLYYYGKDNVKVVEKSIEKQQKIDQNKKRLNVQNKKQESANSMEEENDYK